MTHKVFLGGVCKDTSWRKDFAIPILEKHGIDYYNPQKQVGEWRKELIEEENIAKRECDIILIYINSKYPSITSMLEVIHLASQNKGIFCVIDSFEPVLKEYSIMTHDIKRARSYLKDMIRDYSNITYFQSINEALEALCNIKHVNNSV